MDGVESNLLRLKDNDRLQLDSVLEMRLRFLWVSITVPARIVQFNPPEAITWQGQKFGIALVRTKLGIIAILALSGCIRSLLLAVLQGALLRKIHSVARYWVSFMSKAAPATFLKGASDPPQASLCHQARINY